jgi:HAMP domain-containing protein
MSSQSHAVRFGIRPKLFILVLIGFSVLIGLTVWRIGVEASQVASASVERSLEQSSVILSTKMQSRFSSIRETVTSLAKDGRVLPLVYDGESATLQDLSQEFKQALDFDILFLTDSKGIILARSDRPEAIGRSVAGSGALFDSALHGETVEGIIASQGKLLQIVAAPIVDNVAKDVVRGTAALAYELSPEIAQEINKLTASDIGFYIFERDAKGEAVAVKNTYTTKPALSTALDDYFAKNISIWKTLYSSADPQTRLLISLNDEEFHAVVHPLASKGGGNLGFVMALSSKTELMRPFLNIQRQVLTVGLVCLFIASIIAWLIAHNISRPIISLISVTKKIEDGNYPDAKDYQRSNDEVGVLYDALFRMGKSIKDKAELESYLAQLADDIGDESLLDNEDMLAPEPVELTEEPLFNDTGRDNTKADVTNATVIRDKEDVVYSGEVTQMAQHDTSHFKKSEKIIAGDILYAGEVIDKRYQVIRLLGLGGMGQVYVVKDLDLNETVALKLLNQQNFSDEIIQLFKDEIRLARRITHRNILRTFDFGTWQGFYYITMEFVYGYDLEHLITKKGPLDINIGLVMAKQICSAINAAHEQGIIHRDLKPANMMINKQGILKIMDFGLAMQVQNKKGISPDANANSNSTTVAGTPRYMAPEQFTAGEMDERTDIYAVGVILYILFTGKAPFSALSFEELAMKHIQEKPPLLRSELPKAPPALEKIISKALMKKKEDRYSSIKELIEDLQAI